MTSDPLAAPEPAGAVAVLGTGIMGSAMARNLVAAGLRTTVWDRSPEATAPLAAAGAVVASSAQDAIRDARVVITMLPTADAVESVIFAPGARPSCGAWASPPRWPRFTPGASTGTRSPGWSSAAALPASPCASSADADLHLGGAGLA
jgi:threonine dehydrogenase-like Zn-dependent dehydrogenase